MTRIVLYQFLLLTTLLTFGCGGGGGGGGNTPETFTKATISFSLISTATLPFRISSVEVKASLPAGLSVAASGRTISSGLEAGSAASSSVTTIFPVFGSYSAPNRVTVTIADGTAAQAGFGPGEMARLTCSLAAGTTISESERLSLENDLTFKASGWDPRPTAATNPSSLNTYLRPRIAVTLSN